MPTIAPAARRSRQRLERDPDHITAAQAATRTRLGYPEEFNQVRWMLEEAFDPRTGETIPMPTTLAGVALLTTSQERALDPAALEGYRAAKGERIAWCDRHWMRVPAWGGRARPGGEYSYSARRCSAWLELSLGEAPCR